MPYHQHSLAERLVIMKRAGKLKSKRRIPRTRAAKAKISATMREFKGGSLHSGSKKGPLVRSRSQALAIALSKARKAAS